VETAEEKNRKLWQEKYIAFCSLTKDPWEMMTKENDNDNQQE
jgi:hypothetical protein